MRRRTIICVPAGLALSYPFAAAAQPSGRLRRIGLFIARAADDPEGQRYVAAFLEGLAQQGWRPGPNLEIAYRWAARDPREVEAFAAELAAATPDVLVVLSTPYLRALHKAASVTPIVFVAIADPVGQGFVPSLAQPAGNLTGFGVEEATLGGKWIELLKELAPHVTRIAGIFNPDTSPNARMFLAPMDAVARSLGVDRSEIAVRSEAEIDLAFAALGRGKGGGAIVLPDAFMHSRRERVVASAAAHGVPAIYYDRAFAQAGGLVSYGVERADLFRRAAGYVHLILEGTRPAELPGGDRSLRHTCRLAGV
jgi:putative tryptophan/tyrosine transport system substrate-binding protein